MSSSDAIISGMSHIIIFLFELLKLSKNSFNFLSIKIIKSASSIILGVTTFETFLFKSIHLSSIALITKVCIFFCGLSSAALSAKKFRFNFFE